MMFLEYPFMLQALGLCLLLTGILSFFGHHVVRRGVIFVDLALAQVAALGASVGLLLGLGEDRPVANLSISLGFTLLGALLFSWFRSRRKAPIEALIGITYAGAMAFSLVILEKSATGTEELKEMLVGSILTVPSHQILFMGVLFSVIGILVWWARKPLFLITEKPDQAGASGLRIWWWDFFFYTLFGIVVTVSVRVAGVLLVFSFLIVPSLASVIAVEERWKRIVFGWGFGAVGCILGLETSLRLDWSAGPAIVTLFILLLVMVGLVARIREKASTPG